MGMPREATYLCKTPYTRELLLYPTEPLNKAGENKALGDITHILAQICHEKTAFVNYT